MKLRLFNLCSQKNTRMLFLMHWLCLAIITLSFNACDDKEAIEIETIEIIADTSSVEETKINPIRTSTNHVSLTVK